ncbi:MAG: D-2-hydroxyacid dehydrogenase [Christensenellaceae bacterium]
MKITVLDFCTVTREGDVDFSALEALGQVRYADLVDEKEIVEKYSDTEVFLINKAKITEAVLSGCPNLKYVGTFATGYNNVDAEACKRHGVTVCNAPAYSTEAVSQHTFALLLTLAGSVNRYASSVANGDWVKSKAFSYFSYPLTEICGKTLGIVGMGNIGRSVAKLAEAFSMKVLVHSRTLKEGFVNVSLQELLASSDFVTLHCPLTKENERMIDADALKRMKPTAYLINTARGGLIDEQALADALNAGAIAGAGLDVMTAEPMQADNPLLTAKNCVMTPHIAWAPLETRRRLFEIVLNNLKSYLAGSPVNRVV